MDKIELAKQLQIWFNSADRSDTHFWTNDPIACVIKKNLKFWGKFKNNTGSNAGRRKAFRKMQFVQAKNNGFEGEFEG